MKLKCDTCGTAFDAVSRNSKYCHRHAKPSQGAAFTVPVREERLLGNGYDSAMASRRGMPVAKMVLADKVDQWLCAHDAENECAHGSLPHDKRIGCDCWGAELRTQHASLPAPKRVPVKRPKAKRKPKLRVAA